jgi:hypothetical protein
VQRCRLLRRGAAGKQQQWQDIFDQSPNS